MRMRTNTHTRARTHTQAAEKAKKDADKHKKDAAAAVKAKQEVEVRLKKAEGLIATLQSGAEQDPLDSMTEEKKCVAIKRLLTDETIFKSKAFTTAVISGLEASPPRGCPNTVKRAVTSKLMQLLVKQERDMDGGTSAIALLSRMLSTEDKPVGVIQLLQECVRTELLAAPADDQAAFVQFLGHEWFAGFTPTRESLDDMAKHFAKHCTGVADALEAKRDDVVRGLAELGEGSLDATKFMRKAAGARWLSIKVQATQLRADGDEAGAEALEASLKISLAEIRCALRHEYHRALDAHCDQRQVALAAVVRSMLDRELGAPGVGEALSRSAHLTRQHDKHEGYPDLLDVISDVLDVPRRETVVYLSQLMPGETMALAHSDSGQEIKDRRTMLRYASAMVSREKIGFYAWRGEVDLSKDERKAEKEAAAKTEERNKKMKKPGSRNMSMYEGGKPTAVKTLGTQIAAIYEGKVVADELMDKQKRPREAMPDFLKNFFIRQYGLKSIALKNLQNLAAGVRKECDNNTRLKLFGQLSGMIEPDEYEDGKCNVILEGLKALFPADQIKERLEGSPEMPVASLACATLAAFTSKFYFTDKNDLVTVDGQPDLHPPTKEELVALAGDNPDGLDEDDLSVPIDKWMDYLVNEYQESRGNAEKFFEALYTEYDTNKDNCLDLTEFTTLVHAVDPTRDDSMVMEMYNMALDCSGDGDNIAPDAFVFVAMQYHLPCVKHTGE